MNALRVIMQEKTMHYSIPNLRVTAVILAPLTVFLTDPARAQDQDCGAVRASLAESRTFADFFSMSNKHENPKKALCVADTRDNLNTPETFVPIGCGGHLIVRFDNVLIDVPNKYDLKVIEVGTPESYKVEISFDGKTWITVGTSDDGGPSYFDIATTNSPKGQEFRYVRITDRDSPHCKMNPGADIDAVEALNTSSGPVPVSVAIKSVEIVHPDTLKGVEEVVLGETIVVRVTLEKPSDEWDLPIMVTLRIPDGDSVRVPAGRKTDDSRVFLTNPIPVVD